MRRPCPPPHRSSYTSLSDLWLMSLVLPGHPHPADSQMKKGVRETWAKPLAMAKVDRLVFTPSAPLFPCRAEPRVRGTCPSPAPSTDQASPGPVPYEEPGQAGFSSQTSSILYWPMAASEEGPWTSYSRTGWLIGGGLARWGLGKHRETNLGASEDSARPASLQALARARSSAAQEWLAILGRVWKPSLAGPTSAASPGVTTACGQQVAGELWGALT